MEKGKRALNLGINPHSKGLDFSISIITFFPTLIPNQTQRTTIVTKLIKIIKNRKI
jgi:hypothetical protein